MYNEGIRNTRQVLVVVILGKKGLYLLEKIDSNYLAKNQNVNAKEGAKFHSRYKRNAISMVSVVNDKNLNEPRKRIEARAIVN